jgi:beta-lactamase class A
VRKGFLRVLSALCAAALLSSLCPALAADESAEDIGAQVEAYLAQYNLTGENITIGYRDLRSGEEYYYNGDAAFYGASLYKVALNMYYAREVARQHHLGHRLRRSAAAHPAGGQSDRLQQRLFL